MNHLLIWRYISPLLVPIEAAERRSSHAVEHTLASESLTDGLLDPARFSAQDQRGRRLQRMNGSFDELTIQNSLRWDSFVGIVSF